MSTIKLLIAEDSTLVRRLLAHQLGQEPDFAVVGEASDGREAVAMARDLRPDVMLMDLEMPGLNGIEATGKILSEQPNARIILLTSHENLAPMGKTAGAVDALNKGCTPQELSAAIRKAYLKGVVEAAGETSAATADPGAARDYRADVERVASRFRLTERERMVVEKIIGTENTLQQIALKLSRELKEEVTVSAVKHTLERAMNKLQIEPRTRATLVKFILESGRGEATS